MTDSFYRRAVSFTNARLWKLVHIDVLLMGSLLLLIGGGLFIFCVWTECSNG
jgi:rod shape determining protein RodA